MAWQEKKRKEKTTPFGVNLMRSQVLYWAAQGLGNNALVETTDVFLSSLFLRRVMHT